eukprot:CAMPEP_0113528118 /NCGR_PEP_ID=MMETSP0015_2-20120614/1664_1 /TAXON_ID=2838 /ORGANISM="Odontella" /LENGTH=401 /DNA_ID=CAMNT_0000426609 /DNA_START=13 /DNA_END=1218 /DNA_ORIENTATION=- /assembly_acc=CAM_ASM_000160
MTKGRGRQPPHPRSPSCAVSAGTARRVIIFASIARCASSLQHSLVAPKLGRIVRPFPASRLHAASYGRGAEVWPPTNESPIRLEDSFPGGVVPPAALDLTIPQATSEDDSPLPPPDDAPPLQEGEKKRRKRRVVRAAVSRVLRGAAGAEQADVASSVSRSVSEAFWDAPIDKSPAVVAAALLCSRLVRPSDALAVVAFTGYMTILGLCSSSSEDLRVERGGGGVRVAMPSLPPKGHVPNLVSNPLGVVLTNSAAYRAWLRAGAILGLLFPLFAVGWYALGPNKNMAAASAVARPVFLICCQAVSEASARRLLAPLPLRILVPVAYSAMRLGPIWEWALAPIPLGFVGRILAITNFLYWSANLFGFLLPVATVRYMRAHFFCVEAAEVTLREGSEGSAGLLA